LLTSIDAFVNGSLLAAFVHLREGLHLSHWTPDIAVGIHDLLEGVVLPTKDVVAVVTEAESSGNALAGLNVMLSQKRFLLIAEAPDEGLRAVLGPERLIIELRSIPYCLVHELWNFNWVRGWTRAMRLKSAISRI
jgi:hypothetical protein